MQTERDSGGNHAPFWALALPVLSAGARLSPLAAGILGGCLLLLCSLTPDGNAEYPWISWVRAVWMGWLLGSIALWMGRGNPWAGLILLSLGFWAAKKKPGGETASRILGVTGLALVLVPLLTSLREFRISELTPTWQLQGGELVGLLLLTAEQGEGKTRAKLYGLTLLGSILTAGVLGSLTLEENNPLYALCVATGKYGALITIGGCFAAASAGMWGYGTMGELPVTLGFASGLLRLCFWREEFLRFEPIVSLIALWGLPWFGWLLQKRKKFQNRG